MGFSHRFVCRNRGENGADAARGTWCFFRAEFAFEVKPHPEKPDEPPEIRFAYADRLARREQAARHRVSNWAGLTGQSFYKLVNNGVATLLTTITRNAADQSFCNAKGGKRGLWTVAALTARFDI